MTVPMKGVKAAMDAGAKALVPWAIGCYRPFLVFDGFWGRWVSYDLGWLVYICLFLFWFANLGLWGNMFYLVCFFSIYIHPTRSQCDGSLEGGVE